jgi:hypothetical protein
VNNKPPAVVSTPMSGVCRRRVSHKTLPLRMSIAWSTP